MFYLNKTDTDFIDQVWSRTRGAGRDGLSHVGTLYEMKKRHNDPHMDFILYTNTDNHFCMAIFMQWRMIQ